MRPHWLDHTWTTLDRKAPLLLAAGLAAAAIINAWKWQKDRELAEALTHKPQVAQPYPRIPRVSILVAAWNEAQYIQAHIESILKLHYPNLEYILCAGGGDGTHILASQYLSSGVILLRQTAGEGKQNALRRCLAQASGDIIYLTDADCRLSDESFEAVLAPIINGAEQATTGRFRPLAEQGGHPFIQMQWCVDNYARAHLPQYIDGLIGRNAALTRSLLAATGDLQKVVPIGTDYYLARQILALGSKILYVPESMVETEYHTSMRPYLRQQSRWLRNILLHGRKFQATNQVQSALMQCLSGLMVLLFILTAPLGSLFAVLGLMLVAYAWLARLRYFGFGERTLGIRIRPGAFLLAPFYFLLDQVMLVYTLLTIPHRRYRSRW